MEELEQLKLVRLNPCFNGILKYMKRRGWRFLFEGLNPCFNGILKYCLEFVVCPMICGS